MLYETWLFSSRERKPPGKQFADEFEAYSHCQPSVNFTPHPGTVKHQPAGQDSQKDEDKLDSDNGLLEAAVTQLMDIIKRYACLLSMTTTINRSSVSCLITLC